MKLVREHINEKFEEDSDPIKDISIGIINVHKNFPSYKEAYKFLCKYIIPYIIGNDNIKSILNTEATQQAIIKPTIYMEILQYCKMYLTVSGSKFDINGHDLRNYVQYKKLRESFSEESDPIKDMGIGDAAQFEKTLHDFIYESFDGHWSNLTTIQIFNDSDLEIDTIHEMYNDNFKASYSSALKSSGFDKYARFNLDHKLSQFSDLYIFQIKEEYKYITTGIEKIEKTKVVLAANIGAYNGEERYTYNIKIIWK